MSFFTLIDGALCDGTLISETEKIPSDLLPDLTGYLAVPKVPTKRPVCRDPEFGMLQQQGYMAETVYHSSYTTVIYTQEPYSYELPDVEEYQSTFEEILPYATSSVKTGNVTHLSFPKLFAAASAAEAVEIYQTKPLKFFGVIPPDNNIPVLSENACFAPFHVTKEFALDPLDEDAKKTWYEAVAPGTMALVKVIFDANAVYSQEELEDPDFEISATEYPEPSHAPRNLWISNTTDVHAKAVKDITQTWRILFIAPRYSALAFDANNQDERLAAEADEWNELPVGTPECLTIRYCLVTDMAFSEGTEIPDVDPCDQMIYAVGEAVRSVCRVETETAVVLTKANYDPEYEEPVKPSAVVKIPYYASQYVGTVYSGYELYDPCVHSGNDCPRPTIDITLPGVPSGIQLTSPDSGCDSQKILADIDPGQPIKQPLTDLIRLQASSTEFEYAEIPAFTANLTFSTTPWTVCLPKLYLPHFYLPTLRLPELKIPNLQVRGGFVRIPDIGKLKVNQDACTIEWIDPDDSENYTTVPVMYNAAVPSVGNVVCAGGQLCDVQVGNGGLVLCDSDEVLPSGTNSSAWVAPANGCSCEAGSDELLCVLGSGGGTDAVSVTIEPVHDNENPNRIEIPKYSLDSDAEVITDLSDVSKTYKCLSVTTKTLTLTDVEVEGLSTGIGIRGLGDPVDVYRTDPTEQKYAPILFIDYDQTGDAVETGLQLEAKDIMYVKDVHTKTISPQVVGVSTCPLPNEITPTPDPPDCSS
jgi:hypothetical protein